jgi:hypothetical protein
MLSTLTFLRKQIKQYPIIELAKVEEVPVSVSYVIKPGEPVPTTRLHCKQCHYTAKVRADYAPEQCSNYAGWVDEKGVEHPKCNHRAHWHFWPDDFNPDTCQCMECVTIWHLEKKLLEQEKQTQAAQPALVEAESIAPLRRRGRPPKYKKS